MKYFSLFLLTAIVFLTSGCAGLFVAGAATTANIVTDPRSAKTIWRDTEIEHDISNISNTAPYDSRLRITASSYDGTVVLMGQSPTEALLAQFEAQVKTVQGVKKVHNQVRLKTPLSLGQISQDSWLTTKVKSSLLADGDLTTVKIKVFTEDSEVFLLGYVTPSQAEKATNIARNISGVKQVIKAFEYVAEPQPAMVY